MDGRTQHGAVEATFDGEVRSTSGSTLTSRRNQITAQLIYAVGHFNGNSSGPLLNKVTVSNITYSYSGGLYRIKYRAVSGRRDFVHTAMR